MSHCGSDSPVVVQSETAIAAIGAAVFATQNTGLIGRADESKGRDLPTSTVTCPTFASDSSVSACLALDGNTFGTNPGQYLWRNLAFCQFAGPAKPAWWRTYHNIKFPSQGVCEAVKASPSGITSGTVTGLGLVGQTVELRYGNGAGGDQENLHFGQNGEVLFLYSDYESGWLEGRTNGTTVTFASTTERQVLIKGIHGKNYQTLYGNVRPPQDVYNDLKANPTVAEPSADILTKVWDRTVASQLAGDRFYENKDEASDPTASANSTLSVQWVSNVAVAKAGAIVRTQDNVRRALGISSITADLKYGDATCCWPTEGQVTTSYTTIFNLPSANEKAFTEEVVDFTSTCGNVNVTQRGGELGDGKTSSATLYHCI